jgi:5-methylcytosine-specific restriction protein B
MSRYCGTRNAGDILLAAREWRDKALVGDDSVLGAGLLWTLENLSVLNQFFVENLDEGEGAYIDKLRKQLEPTAPSVKQLAAEMNWLMLLCPSNIKVDTKRQQVETIWNWSGLPLPGSASKYLTDSVLSGVGSAGTAFNTLRWLEFAFAIEFASAFKRLTPEERITRIGDGWSFADWLETIPGSQARQLRHMILFLLFPDDFERIFAGGDRRKVATNFSGLSSQAINAQTPAELDRTLRRIRTELEAKHGTNELDYYVPPLKELWKQNDFEAATQDITVEHVLAALAEIDRTGVPPGGESTGYDLIHLGKRYPPKVVLSLAAKAANGTEFDRSQFSGGEDSSAFRLLRKLGFTIERKSVLEDTLQKFVFQANSGNDLTTRSYPTEYRSLKLSVSFGKGNFARVPWISFLGPRQETQNGIYPVVLYYKDAGWLVVANGVSETETPKASWPQDENARSVRQFFDKEVGRQPERYGDSTVVEAFRADDNLDIGLVSRAIEQTIDRYLAIFHGAIESPPAPKFADEPYTLEDAAEGLFIDLTDFSGLVQRLRERKNLIIQGPPGVGKTFFARRLAYALMGRVAKSRVGMIQFHAAYTYEDFVQGYRPGPNGFALKNGIFLDFCRTALKDSDHDYVFIIDEINRGNLSKIFGEIMMLIERDKRYEEWSIPLTYSSNSESRFYIPPNVHLIGLMNTADRSIAMVDYALRRRFSFAELSPAFSSPRFAEYLRGRSASDELVQRIVREMTALNMEIAADKTNLGGGFCIGHSYFCGAGDVFHATNDWYKAIVLGEVMPLLREYWFDNLDKAHEWERRLLLE